MHHDQMTVASSTDVGFHHVHAHGDAMVQRLQRILRRGGKAVARSGGMTAAMGDDHHAGAGVRQTLPERLRGIDGCPAAACKERRGKNDSAKAKGLGLCHDNCSGMPRTSQRIV